MKPSGSSLSFYAAAVIIALVLGVLLFQCRRDPLLSMPTSISGPPTPTLAPAAALIIAPSPTTAPIPTVLAAPVGPPALTPTPIALQDGKTIDYSSGKAVIRDSAQEKAIIDAAVKEMDAAASGITFGPAAPTPTKQ